MKDLFRISGVTHFELPLLPNNIPFACHPEFQSISLKIDKWFLGKMRIADETSKKKVLESRIGLYACMMHPHAKREKLVLAGKHLWAVFLLDDLLESSSKHEMPQLNLTISNLANGNSDEDYTNPLLALYREVMEEIRAAMEPPLLDRYVQCVGASLEAVKDQVHRRAEKSIPGVEEYKLARRATGFMEAVGGIMTEFCIGIRLSQAQIQSPIFRELLNSVSDHVILVNDLLSFRKEFYGGDYHHNWISVLLHHSPRGTSFQDVVDRLCEMIQAEELSILALRKKIADEEGSDSELTKFAREFPMVASGSLVWSYVTGRYHGYGNPLLTGEIFSGTWLLHPMATVVLPSKFRMDTMRFSLAPKKRDSFP
ncbi:hypothetical protein SELMODRAFT_413294 [Selaginella moellendorffii]|uniref:(3S,6E)-nerolidol synthase n=1 Tax=Selaginella moellendorffii TaxID=88036 RepID=MTS22_SELML|eukprot:XP_002972952.1 (3S,6E)-nerolidol synthase [Selaginella moellendorffii]